MTTMPTSRSATARDTTRQLKALRSFLHVAIVKQTTRFEHIETFMSNIRKIILRMSSVRILVLAIFSSIISSMKLSGEYELCRTHFQPGRRRWWSVGNLVSSSSIAIRYSCSQLLLKSCYIEEKTAVITDLSRFSSRGTRSGSRLTWSYRRVEQNSEKLTSHCRWLNREKGTYKQTQLIPRSIHAHFCFKIKEASHFSTIYVGKGCKLLCSGGEIGAQISYRR